MIQCTKEDCYKIGYFSEKYFSEGFDEKGNYVFFDKETGEVAAIIEPAYEHFDIMEQEGGL